MQPTTGVRYATAGILFLLSLAAFASAVGAALVARHVEAPVSFATRLDEPSGGSAVDQLAETANIFVGRVVTKAQTEVVERAAPDAQLTATFFVVEVEQTLKGEAKGTVEVREAGGDSSFAAIERAIHDYERDSGYHRAPLSDS